MNSTNILSVISTYLDLKSLLEFILVNKTFQKVTKSQLIWRCHFESAFFGDLSFFGYFLLSETLSSNYLSFGSEPTNYHSLLILRSEVSHYWTTINTESVSPQNFDDLKSEFFAALREPLLPSPRLRREALAFPTVVQDLLGNASVQPSAFDLGYFCPLFDVMRERIDMFEDQFNDALQVEQLSTAKWLLKKSIEEKGCSRYSLASQSTTEDLERPQSLVLCLMRAVKSMVKSHCKAVCAFLSSFTEPLGFLSTYCMLVKTI